MPAMTTPSPVPVAKVPVSSPTASGRCASGTTRRARAIASGKTPPPRPCSVRPAINSPIEPARPAIARPTMTTGIRISRTSRGPNVSPSRPITGVVVAATTSTIVSVQLDSAAVVPNWSAVIARVGATIERGSAAPSVAMTRVTRLTTPRCDIRARTGSLWAMHPRYRRMPNPPASSILDWPRDRLG